MTAWGAYIQQGLSKELEMAGSQLSIEIDCPVHYPAYDKNLFECKHGVLFPVWIPFGQNWDIARQKHEDEKKTMSRING